MLNGKLGAQWEVRCSMGSYVLNRMLLCTQLDIIEVLNGKLGAQQEEIIMCSTGHYWCAQWEVMCSTGHDWGAQQEVICSTGHYWGAQWEVM